jgi:hypothetical protein
VGRPSALSKHITPAPLDAACLVVLAERMAGGKHADETAVVGLLVRREVTALLGRDAATVRVDLPEGASPQVRRDAYAAKLREMIRDREDEGT